MNEFAFNYEFTLFFRLLFAAIIGGIIGFEREYHGREAGLRTHSLVCVGACLMMVISESFAVKYGAELSSGILRVDPSRVAAQIVTGIGFLGAGAIIKEGASVRGLTTAAGLWVAAGLGMAVGSGLYFAAAATAVLSLIVLLLLRKVDSRIRKKTFRFLVVRCSSESGNYEKLAQFFIKNAIEIVDFSLEKDWANQEDVYYFTVRPSGSMRVFPVDSMGELEFVKKVFFP
ncbi:MAG: MgtC/SapB family protein [Deltaproteobacteria bacterium]|nr:MgtC/SapB family protein [Deltaproteobacteria bacterium]